VNLAKSIGISRVHVRCEDHLPTPGLDARTQNCLLFYQHISVTYLNGFVEVDLRRFKLRTKDYFRGSLYIIDMDNHFKYSL